MNPGSNDWRFSAAGLASIARLRRELLPKTLAYATAQVPWYRRRFGERWRAVRGPEDLPKLPLLTKEEAVAHQGELLAGPLQAFAGTISSGTQHGDRRPLRVPATEAERWALGAYEGALPAVKGSGADRGLVLEVLSMQHGIPEAPPPPGVLRMPWTFTANAFRLFEELLSARQPGRRRVRYLIAGAGAIVPLTVRLIERGEDPARFGIREIGTTGFRLSDSWRARLCALWGAEVFDNYSLSEFATPAVECRACGFNHWASPPLVFEVLDAFTRAPLERGTGLLVVTTLYPFVQAMPLLRYLTGDLVELGPRCRAAGDRGFRCRGRASQALLRRGLPGEPIVVSAQDVESFLDGRPEAAREPHPCAKLGLLRSSDVGVVRFELEWRGRIALVRTELRFDPRLFPNEAESLGRALAAHLLARSPRLRRLEASGEGELEVALVAPGTLTRRWSKF
ncbi:MAG: phenylacetate--CoA ligase family protein [Myxococcaceae bacterium]